MFAAVCVFLGHTACDGAGGSVIVIPRAAAITGTVRCMPRFPLPTG